MSSGGGGSRRNVDARESDSSGASKRSDEPAGRRMNAQKLSPKGGAGNSVKLADETKDKQASSERQQQQQQIESQSAQSQANKLVFGLNPRAHRPQPQRAASKSGNIEQAGQEQDKRANDCVKTKPIEPITSQFINNLGSAKTSQRPVGQADAPTKRSSQVRASKYGNFYKPQDLTTTTAAACPTTTTTMTTTSTSDKADNKANNEQTATLTSSSTTRTTMIKSSSDDQKKGQTRKGGKQQASRSAASGQDQAKEATSANERPTKGGANVRPNSVRSTSKSPDRSKQMARRKSFDEDISTIKTESSPVAVQQQQQPILKTRTQFNILPPPQLAIATTGKGSVVGYAKSRIYDRPVKQILANPPESTYSALDDRSGQIPASILSGFKPPKQVNVSKAREKWEGGEPFAKCKSRRRLAAQANKKLFPGTWSMTSVVATQQLHLQQALAQSASSANHRSNPLDTDPSVKVLTRGSVLERVQQFEKVPPSADAGRAGDGLDGVASGGSLDSMLFDYELTSQTSTGSSLSRSSSLSSTTSSLGSDGGATVGQQQVDSASKQAQYKSQVSSIQQQQQRSASTNVISAISPSSAATPLALAGQPAPVAVPAQQRRLSLRRRSSLGLGRSSTESLIPKFYHPNGKPNTYEIEIQKRNIVACFDKFPERKAQTGTSNPVGRKQFHKIALACGYSEYFKVPLQRFIVHKLETDPKLAQMMSASNQAAMRQRKSSTIALNTNGTSSTTSSLRLLVKAASVDSSTPTGPSASTDSNSSPLAPTNDKKEPVVNYVSCDQFLACWRDLISQAYDNAAQFIHLLTLGQRNYLTPDDFVPLVQSIIDDHPGLKFLRAAPDFHMRYIQTVIARIYFNVNRSWTGKITLQELRKSNLLAVLQVLGQEEDINQITDYFSYEHFYVIYCKFWNLDQDHDLFISKEDLARHNDAAISSRIIERIFSGIVSKQIQKTGRMSYSDFVWFLIAEEDKKHPRSVEYWFRIMDLDGDGYISMYEMEYFYYEQTKRLELMNIEALPFLDSACQILDLVNPREKNKISLADLKRNKMATIFFDTFINLEKYLEHESREFVSTRDIVQGGVVISDWDRYASEEYENLVTEESSV